MKKERRKSPVRAGKHESVLCQSLLLWVASIVPFISSLHGDFVFDDAESVVNNVVVNGKTSLAQIFHRDFWGKDILSSSSHKSFRPVTTFTFWLNFYIHGDWTTGFHVINILLHLVVVMLLYHSLRRWHFNEIAFPASLAFAVHPIHTEVVANITGRAELLSAAFGLLSLLMVSTKEETNNIRNYTIQMILVTLATFSKEQGIVFMPLSLLLCYLRQVPITMRRVSFTAIVTSLLVLLRCYINDFQQPIFSKFDNAAAFIENPLWKLTNFSYLWLYHLYLMVVPVNLCFDYSMGSISLISSFNDWRVLSPLIVTMLLVGSITLAYKLTSHTRRIFIVAMLLGLISFFPASNILVSVGFTVAERVLYVPSIGYCILAAMLINHMKSIWSHTDALVMVMLALAVSKCYHRSAEWSSEVTLYSSGLSVCPQNAKIHYNLAKVLGEQGYVSQAENNYWKALSLNPTYEHALNNLANILEKNGRGSEAERLLRKAVSITPSFATAWMNLGITLMNNGKLNDSEKAFSNSLKIRPLSADCWFNQGNLYQRMGRSIDAKNCWRNATSIDPSHSNAWSNLLVVMDELHECPEVVLLSERALEYGRGKAAIHSQIGSCLAQVGELEKAEVQLLTAIRLSPHVALYQANLGILYQRWRRFDLAEKLYRQALALDENSTAIRDNLQNLVQRNRNGTRFQ